MKPKTAEEVLKEVVIQWGAANETEWEEGEKDNPVAINALITAMHSHTSQYLDLCVEIIRKRGTGEDILELKNNMK